MHSASPTSDDGFETYLSFHDTLFHELAMFACEHPALLPEQVSGETIREEEELGWLTARLEDLKAGRAVPPRRRAQPPRPTARQVRARRATVVMYCRTIRQLAASDADIERLLDAFAHGLAGDQAREHAGLAMGAYLATFVRLNALVESTPSVSV